MPSLRAAGTGVGVVVCDPGGRTGAVPVGVGLPVASVGVGVVDNPAGGGESSDVQAATSSISAETATRPRAVSRATPFTRSVP